MLHSTILLRILLWLSACLFASSGFACATVNWEGNYPACAQRDEVRKPGPLNLGVRILSTNTSLAREFQRAMQFWANILELEWHTEDSNACAIELVDGAPELFTTLEKCSCVTARSQSPDRPGYQGWIAFNPKVNLTDQELFRTSVHEIGHLLGLSHNANTSSVMYFLDLDSPFKLDSDDLRALALRHKLRQTVYAGK